MKKRLIPTALLVLVAVALCFIQAGGQGNGYNSAQLTVFSTAGSSGTVLTPGSSPTIQQNQLIGYHEIFWTPTSASGCTVTVDSSTNGTTWVTGGIIGSQTCTSAGNSAITAATANYIRITVSALTGTSVQIQYEGWAYNPSGSTGLTSLNASTGLTATGTGCPSACTGATTLTVTNPVAAGAATDIAIYTGTNAVGADASLTDASGTLTYSGANGLTSIALGCGVLNTTSCVISGFGGTSGSATLTWPLVAGSISNAIISTNRLSAPGFILSTQGHMFATGGAPTIASGFGGSSSIVANNGTIAFTVNVGLGGSASSGVITLPAAVNGWLCYVSPNGSPQAAGVTYSAPTSTTSVTLTNYTASTGVALAWSANYVLSVSCFAY